MAVVGTVWSHSLPKDKEKVKGKWKFKKKNYFTFFLKNKLHRKKFLSFKIETTNLENKTQTYF